jgi:hypothetical protein
MRIAGVLCVLPICLAVWSQAAQAKDGPRLKFKKKGPVCMCSGGLSEKDILLAQRLRKQNHEQSPVIKTQQSKIDRLQDDNKEE